MRRGRDNYTTYGMLVGMLVAGPFLFLSREARAAEYEHARLLMISHLLLFAKYTEPLIVLVKSSQHIHGLGLEMMLSPE